MEAMTTEDLHKKSDIALQLAWRDAEIERLTALIPKPDADGWIAWVGGDCPVPADTIVEVRHRAGSVGQGRADNYYWHHYGTSGDIVAYRIVEAQHGYDQDRSP